MPDNVIAAANTAVATRAITRVPLGAAGIAARSPTNALTVVLMIPRSRDRVACPSVTPSRAFAGESSPRPGTCWPAPFLDRRRLRAKRVGGCDDSLAVEMAETRFERGA